MLLYNDVVHISIQFVEDVVPDQVFKGNFGIVKLQNCAGFFIPYAQSNDQNHFFYH